MLSISFYFIFFLPFSGPPGSAPEDKIFPSTLWFYVHLGGIHSIRQKTHPQIFSEIVPFLTFGFSWDGWGTLPVSFFQAYQFDWGLWGIPFISDLLIFPGFSKRLYSHTHNFQLCHTFRRNLLILASLVISLGWEFPKSARPGSFPFNRSFFCFFPSSHILIKSKRRNLGLTFNTSVWNLLN